ncbi:type I 3-dehydroquinate dehydratase [Propionivibrio sp.]|uniref:type I 3-dehydroquinate dehydratase n=1 Tax=Propionivibrio sp. TaxID=2212460 RepID=UPI00272E12E4|nr:type I 3-dehydroquinate dehydratase [Propionivibrio sp.]
MKETRLIQVQGKSLGGGTLPAIITPLVGKTRAAILEEVAFIVPKKPDLLEWRIDFFEAIGDIPAVIETALAIREAADGIPVLLTRRNVTEGGQPLTIDEPAVVAMYTAACQAKCVELIDYELSNAPADIQALREVSKASGIGMIMSFHNFQMTPDAATLDSKFAAAKQYGADVGKVAVMPNSDLDVLELLAATSRARETLDIPLISMSMGGVGSLSRIMGWVYGSAATFAVGKSSSAPGQVAIEDLRTALAIVRQAVTGGQ